MKKHKNKIIFCVITLAILVTAFVLPDIYRFENNVSKPPINETHTVSSAIEKNIDTSKTDITISETQNQIKKEEPTEPKKTDAYVANNNSKSPTKNNDTTETVVSVEKNSVAKNPEKSNIQFNSEKQENVAAIKNNPIATNNKSDIQNIVENEVSVDKTIDVETSTKTETNKSQDIQNITKNDETIEQAAPKQEDNDNTAQKPVQNNESTCSISVKCTSILNNIEQLDKEKRDIIPLNGIIFENNNAVFYENESVFNVLSRELKKNDIHFEFVKSPVYKSVYIEGIGNIYEFDCGELSGWLYKVNGITPSYGCSQYIIKNGDVIEFIYSVNMGTDIN